MPPNFNDVSVEDGPQSEFNGDTKGQTASTAQLVDRSEYNYKLKIFYSSLNLLTHTLIGIVIGVAIFFAFRNGIPIGATPLHIVLCVIGYQLLMAQAILALSPHNGWTLNLRLVDKRRAHWILQIVGSGLAIVGSFIKILDKSVHWNTLHGQFALVALVFTVACFFNGLTSNYTYELRKFIPGTLSKLTHICFGVVAFSASCICLSYGFDKNSFRLWAGDGVTQTAIAFTGALTTLIILNPLIVFFNKGLGVVKK